MDERDSNDLSIERNEMDTEPRTNNAERQAKFFRSAKIYTILLLHWTNANSHAQLVPEYQEALFAPDSPFDTTRFFVIIPDDIGHGHSSKPSDGLKASFPPYGYGDMVDLQHKLIVESLGIAHLRAVVGMSMGCMNAWQWAEAYPDAIDGIMLIACFPLPSADAICYGEEFSSTALSQIRSGKMGTIRNNRLLELRDSCLRG